jgi:LysM repeat protein
MREQQQRYARYALPGLLLALVIGTLFILVVSGSSGNDKADKQTTTQTVAKKGPKTMRVRPGDSPSTIAERAGIPLETLEELNPRMDPRALHLGDRLKIRP